MKTPVKIYTYSTLGLAAVIGAVIAPVIASAETDSSTINATLGSSISVTSAPTVNFSITPVSGGAQSSQLDTVLVSTNNSAGYTLTLANTDTTLTLSNGTDTIAASANTFAAPAALANNTWGYALEGGNFSVAGSYDTLLTSATSSATEWAGVPSSAAPQQLKTTDVVASADPTEIWYSAKADTTKSNGVYTDDVTYTATAD